MWEQGRHLRREGKVSALLGNPTLPRRAACLIVGLLAVSSGFGDQVSVVPAWRVDEGVVVSLAA